MDEPVNDDVALKLLAGGVRDVTLPTGLVIRGRLPTVEDLWIRDLVPQDLLTIVSRFAAGATLKDLPTEEQPLWYRYLRLLVAAYIQAVRDPEGAWHTVHVSIDGTMTMDPHDVDALEYIVLRLKTPEQVTAESRAILGEITKEEASAIAATEAPKTMTGWATFREFVAGIDAGQDGADLQPAPEPDARPNRAARRSRARRSPSPAATG